MKRSNLIIALMVSAAFAFSGCGGGGQPKTAQLESSFAGAEAPVKSDVQKAVSAIKVKDYASAVVELQKISAKAKLNDAQRAAVKDLVEQLQALIASGANDSVQKAAGEASKTANKALQDAQKSLNK